MKKILFSPVGSTDPISTCHDGALLHIIRNYRPEKVILYMSKEICGFENKDRRYSYCLNKIQEHLKYEFEIEVIKKEDLTEVQIFDGFLLEFKGIIENLTKENVEILLNVSSGTPAMKSALQTLATFSDTDLVPIQVSTPTKKINIREDIKGEYNVDIQWECNEDNEENFENRCTVSSTINMANEVKKKIMQKLIDEYDYPAALTVANTINNIDSKVVNLIKAGEARLCLDKGKCSELCRKVGYDPLPIKNSEEIDSFEYFMITWIKLQKKEYSDFIRSISPLFFIVMEKIIMKNFPLRDYMYEPKNANVNGHVKKMETR